MELITKVKWNKLNEKEKWSLYLELRDLPEKVKELENTIQLLENVNEDLQARVNYLSKVLKKTT
jgi:hypothetical protein